MSGGRQVRSASCPPLGASNTSQPRLWRCGTSSRRAGPNSGYLGNSAAAALRFKGAVARIPRPPVLYRYLLHRRAK